MQSNWGYPREVTIDETALGANLIKQRFASLVPNRTELHSMIQLCRSFPPSGALLNRVDGEARTVLHMRCSPGRM